MTTAPAIGAWPGFNAIGTRPRAPETGGASFAKEFAGCTKQASQKPRSNPNSDKQQKRDDSKQQSANVSAPVMLPVEQDLDPRLPGDGSVPSIPIVEPGALQPDPLSPAPRAGDDPQATAFSLRIESPAPNPEAAQSTLAAIRKLTEVDDEQPSAAESPAPRLNLLAAFEQNRELNSTSEIRPVAEPPRAAAAQMQDPREMPKAPEPLNHIMLQVGPSPNEKIVVNLMQQSGELRLAVRTDDAHLAHSLQQGLSDLVGKIQENGYRAESWKPVQAPAAAAAAAETRDHSSASGHRDAQSQSGASQQDGGQRRQNPSNRPRWVEELESNLSAKGPSTGESYGFSR